jgi:hydrogenase/urease accessory protein HupE
MLSRETCLVMKKFRMLCLFVLTCLCMVLVLPSSLVQAHDNSPGYSDIEIGETNVTMQLYLEQIFLLDVAHTPWNGDPMNDAYLQQNGEQMKKAVAEKLTVEANGQRLKAVPTGLKISNRAGVDMIEFDYEFPSPQKIENVSITNDIYVRNSRATHTNFATIKMGGQTTEFVFQNDDRTYKVGDVKAAFSTGTMVKQFLLLGIKHILTGYDHLLFLLTLLLVAGSFKDIVKIVTTFTIAHTITLILAALNVISLPSKWVEAAIALTICYVAAENLYKKQFSKRWMLTLGLGLIHGFGFAGALAEMDIPKSHQLTALLTFNVGVELGQMAVVAVLLPILLYLRRFKWHRQFVRTGSGLIFALGFVWLLQRLFWT